MAKPAYHFSLGPRVRSAVARSRSPIKLSTIAERASKALGRHVSVQAVNEHVKALVKAGQAKRGRGTVERVVKG